MIFMYCHEKHGEPHIHADYNGVRASFSVRTGRALSGNLPPQQERLVRRWLKERRDVLLKEWESATSGRLPRAVPPLQ